MAQENATYDCDVAIVGTGVAGALIGWKLAAIGMKVIMLDAGPTVDRTRGIKHAVGSLIPSLPEAASIRAEWAPAPSSLDPNNYLVQTGPDMFVSNYERQVGGTTWHWLGTSVRLIPSDFAMKSTFGVGVDWPIGYAELEPWYQAAEQMIGVAGKDEEENLAPRSGPYPMPPIPLTYSDKQFATAVTGLGLTVTHTPQARVSVVEGFNKRPQCCGSSFCIPMCPIGAKYDATVHVDLAAEAGAQVLPNSVVHRLEHDAEGKITRLTYRQPDGTDVSLTARAFVVAAHAIETPKVLLMSASEALPTGLANASDQVGRNLMDHPTQLSYALATKPMGPYRAPLSTAGIEDLRDGEERARRSAYRIEIGNDGWSWPGLDPVGLASQWIHEGVWGTELYDRIREVSVRAVRMAALCEQLPDPNSRVGVSDKLDPIGIPRPSVSYAIDDYAKQGLNASRKTFDEIFTALGVESITHVEQIQGAGHIMGTYRMGADPKTSVTDSYGRTWDHANLWLAGSGLFPTTGTGNPTLTIAALAIRTAEELASNLGAETSA
ncbi:MAG: GMC family oxidoreductase [Thermomicrobiales bacterium]|nr:GMC family oxidoreductase [Thermomicrobiales bacterium]